MSPMPAYAVKLNYNSYFGTTVLASKAISKIIMAWETEPAQFKTNIKHNTLAYSFPDNADYDMRYIAEELPPVLEANLASRTLVMNLKEAQAFFGMKFKRTIFGVTK